MLFDHRAIQKSCNKLNSSKGTRTTTKARIQMREKEKRKCKFKKQKNTS